MIIFKQALSEDIVELLDELEIRGFTKFTDLQYRGNFQGELRMGTHTWPALNNAMLTVTKEAKAADLISRLQGLDRASEEQGLKAFRWEVETVVG
ncbi:hypothetical protein FVR03_09275 [Pontibacter qinzhouensis]|uniref:Uncharacterized protein n=1 Tax=Pontibacter qinzhouensis TaxID=2603253 RepID=A0A5C8K814_9BACT|nr:PG0541 family transporter-associated protein [Pontibacter qinzhouensis]TXK47573.1 hypothetical protein FVR03_09275 [Pontibacter qinzhouensis]